MLQLTRCLFSGGLSASSLESARTKAWTTFAICCGASQRELLGPNASVVCAQEGRQPQRLRRVFGSRFDLATDGFTVLVNQLPVLTNPGAQANDVGDTVSLQLAATDPESAPLSYSAGGLPSGLSINLSNGLISGSPSAAGTYNPSVTVQDNLGGSANETFTWTINAVNQLPVGLLSFGASRWGSGAGYPGGVVVTEQGYASGTFKYRVSE